MDQQLFNAFVAPKKSDPGIGSRKPRGPASRIIATSIGGGRREHQAQRPDLACEAVTILADKLAADGRALEACHGLMGTILRYPQEGRYVPKLVDQIDRLSRAFPEADQQLAAFFQKFLPTIPRERSSTPSKYCIAMYEKGIAKYRAVGQESLALAAAAELAKIRAIGQ